MWRRKWLEIAISLLKQHISLLFVQREEQERNNFFLLAVLCCKTQRRRSDKQKNKNVIEGGWHFTSVNLGLHFSNFKVTIHK
jgi:hypothetical protein